MKLTAFVTLTCLGLLLCAHAAIGADANSPNPAAPRQFAPVQGGSVTSAATVLPYAEDRLLVQFTRDATRRMSLNIQMRKGSGTTNVVTGLASVDAILSAVGASRIERPYAEPRNRLMAEQLGVDRWYMLRVQPSADMVAMAQRFSADPNIEAASPDWRAFPTAVPNDPLYPNQWGHNNTAQMPDYCWGCGGHPNGTPVGTPGFDSNAQTGWDAPGAYGSSGVVIAILDSGVDVGHPDLNQVAGWDYGDNDSNPDDDSANPGHGTACAGIAAAISNNSLGVSGIAGGCSIMPLKVADSNGTLFFSYIQNGIYHAADNGADIASMSFGASISSDPATDTALQYAFNNGVTLVGSTGNDNTSSIGYPANNVNVIAVGAASNCGERKRSSSNPGELNPGVSPDPNGYTCDGERWWGSDYGSATQGSRFAVDVIAPTIMPTTDIQGFGGYASGDYSMWFNGTSCSTPYAAGVCALILTANPSLTPTQVRNQLTSTAQDVISVESGAGWDRYTGYGMVDAAAAVNFGPVAPVAEFSGSPTSGTVPLNVSFTDQSSGSPTSWSWTFGDGGTSTAQNPSHTYNAAGTYTVSLTATNSAGSDVETKAGYITVSDPSGSVTVNANADLPVSGTVIGTYQNTHASDNTRQEIEERESGGKKANRYTFLEHKWTFNVPSNTGATFSLEGSRTDNGEGDNFVFAWSTNDVNYTDLFTVSSATEQTYSATLAGAPSGTIYIRVVDTDQTPGNRSKDRVSIDHMFIEAITGPSAPVANFVGSPTSGSAPLLVQFTDQSTGAPTSWSWTFGDGGTSTAQNPSHTYNANGTYTVTLTATNGNGSDVESKSNYITVADAASEMFVFDIVVSKDNLGRGQKRGRADVTIHDAGGQPVSGATVTGDFSDLTSEPGVSATTNSNGVATLFTTGTTQGGSGQWCFEVTNVTHGSLSYNASLNNVTKSCENTGDQFSADVAAAAPTAFKVENHPNPFNPRTRISFSLPAASHVRLEVFDVSGRAVGVLANGHYGPGVHDISWDASGYSSGIYYARLSTGTKVVTNRMILLK